MEKPLLSAARAARRAMLLDEAAVEFRDKGIAGADLTAIARKVGLTRSSLYNYCADRNDLARQCYFHLLDPLSAALDRAAEGGGAGLASVLRFIEAAREHDQTHAIVAAELDVLPRDQREAIVVRQNAVFARLAALIERGIDDRSIRPVDPAIAARTIWGMLAWTPLGEIWARRADPDRRGRSMVELSQIVEHGVATGTVPARETTAPIAWSAPLPEPTDRAAEIVLTATALFNARGVDGVTLDDVAEAMGATKGLIYHYFENKADLVSRCLDRAFAIYDSLLDEAEHEPIGVDRARVGLMLNVQAQLDPAGPMALAAVSYRGLRATEQDRFTEQTIHLVQRSVATMLLGNADGTLRVIAPEPTVLASAGTFNFVARWVPVDGAMSPSDIAVEVSDLFLFGLGAT